MKKRAMRRAAVSGEEMGWAATSTLLGGMFVWGGVGWLLDQWWGTRFATPIGVILGMALGIYAVVMRFGREPAHDAPTHDAPTHDAQTTTDRPADPHAESEPASLER